MGTLSVAYLRRERRAEGRAARSDGASARAVIYHALAEALAEPTADSANVLLDAVTLGAQALASAACQKAARALAELPSPDRETLHESYVRLVAGPGRPLVLYESFHRQGRLASQVTWDVYRHYQALGLMPANGELPDHASMELAFLGYLAAAEAEAQASGEGLLAARLRAEQRSFLHTHVGAWLPHVGAALAAANDRFYAVVGRLLTEFLSEELTGRQRNEQIGTRLPLLKDPAACTLCGLCAGSCPSGALQISESTTETVLLLAPARCVSCNRCAHICPEGVMILSLAAPAACQAPGAANASEQRVLRRSPRATCPNCGQPTVSQAELDAVFTRLQADPATRQRLSLCVECKLWQVATRAL